MTERNHIDEEVLATLRAGSYEERIERVRKALDEADFLGSGYCLEASFAKSALVSYESGELWHVRLADHGKGLFAVEGRRTCLPADAKDHVESNAREVAALLMAGSTDQAFDLLRSIAPMVPAKRDEESELVQRIIAEHINAPRPWKELMAEKGSAVDAFLEGVAIDGECNPPEALDFTVADALPMSESEVEARRDGVVARINKLVEALDALGASVESSRGRLRESADSSGSFEPSFEAFCEDLEYDVGSVRSVLEGAAWQLSEIVPLARLYGTALELYPEIERAVRFIEAVAQQWKAAD